MNRLGGYVALPPKQCTLIRIHDPHRWFARGVRRYFQCPGIV